MVMAPKAPEPKPDKPDDDDDGGPVVTQQPPLPMPPGGPLGMMMQAPDKAGTITSDSAKVEVIQLPEVKE
jgi:hypothetical protein